MRKYNFPVLRAVLSAMGPHSLLSKTGTRSTEKNIKLRSNNGSIIDISVPKEVVTQVTKLKENGVAGEDIIQTIARGEWAYPLAKAFCLPEDRFSLPENILTPEERACIDTVSKRLARELLGGG